MKNWLLGNKLFITGTLVGAVAGFLYWKFVGCNSGTCVISSKPLNSSAYFAVMGALLFSAFKRSQKKATNKDKS